MNWNLAHPAFEQSIRTPDALALAADGVEQTYAEVARQASRLAAALNDRGIGRGSRVGILGSRSLIALEAVLGIAWAGASYVPLGLRWPEDRLSAVLAQVELDALVVDDRGLALLTRNVVDATTLLAVPSDDAASAFASVSGRETLSLASLPPLADIREPASMLADDLAYVIFTSGTTGVPKGVMVATASVAAYLAALGLRKAMTPEDRASQFTELSFDPSLGEIFLPWSVGASIHVVPALSQVSPAKFIRDRRPDDLGLHSRGDRVDARYAHAPAGIAAGTSLHVVRRRAASRWPRCARGRPPRRTASSTTSMVQPKRPSTASASASSRGRLRSLRRRAACWRSAFPIPAPSSACSGRTAVRSRTARRASSPSGAVSSRSVTSMRPS